MSGINFIPAPNGKFNDWQKNFTTVAPGYFTGWGLPTAASDEWDALVTDPGNKQQRWITAYNIVSSGEFTHSQEVEMLDARNSYESGRPDDPDDTSLRLFIKRYIRYNPRVTKAQKQVMGLLVPDEVITQTSPDLAKSEEAGLMGKVASAQHLLQNSEVTVPGQKSKAKGEGVEEIQVFLAFTDATTTTPPDLKDFAYDGTVTWGKYKRNFDPSQVGKKAWYYARVMIKGKTKTYGPPSEYWNAVVM
jgi:hypothetical protein